MKELENRENHFTIIEGGKVYISQRKTGELLGIPKSTIHAWVTKNSGTLNLNKKNQLDAKSVVFMAKMGRPKYEQCEVFLDKVTEGGANKLLQHMAGYSDTKPQFPAMTEMEMIVGTGNAVIAIQKDLALKADKTEVSDLRDKVNNLAKKKVKLKSKFCSEGFYTIGSMVNQLSDSGHPIAHGAVRKLLRYYQDSIRKQDNCYNRNDVDKVLKSVIDSAIQLSPERVLDPESEIAFKATWIK